MKEEIFLDVNQDGKIEGFYDEIEKIFDEKDFCVEEKKRVSRIVPKNIFLRVFFYIVRFFVSDSSPIADWTRKWKCKWIVIIDGKKEGEFKDRKKAVEKEKNIIRNRRI